MPRLRTRFRRVLFPAVGLVTGVALLAFVPALAASASTGGAALLASSSFGRSSAASWGVAEKGGVWSTYVPRGAAALVTAGQARFQSLPAANSAEAVLKAVSGLDTDATAVFGVPSGVTTYTALEVRHQASGDTYRARLEVSPNGSAAINVTRVRNKVEVSLGAVAVPFTVSSAAATHVELQVAGTTAVTVSARAWTGSTVPTKWLISRTDSSSSRIASPGAVGIWQYASSRNHVPVTTTFDNVTAVSVPAAVTAPPVITPVPVASTAPAPSPTAAPTPVVTPPAPAPAPAPAPTPARAPALALPRGSAAPGSTSYAVPSNALVVSPAGNDTAVGTVAAPLKTVGAAVAKAVTGQTVVLRAGTYNESVVIPSSKSLTVQSYPGEAVWFDGSQPVSAWTAAADATWSAPWGYFPSGVMDGIQDNPYFVSSTHPFAARPDQVFFDGSQLTQVGSAAQVTSGTFFPDASTGRIIIGSNPTGHTVRVSNQPQAFDVNSPNTVLQGFGIRDYGTSYLQRGAVRLSSTGDVARNLVIQDNAMIGINIENDTTTLDHVTVTGSGLLGIGANESYGLKISNSVVTGNNSQMFNAAPVAGGIKVTRSRGVTISNVNASSNNGNGIWFDESVYNGSVVNSTASNNTFDGIIAEISDHILVAGNQLNDNKMGVQIYNTANVEVLNNDIGGNAQFGVKLAQDERRQANTSITGHDRRQPLPDPTLTWVVKNVTIENNAFGNGGLYQVYGLDGVTNIPMDDMQVTITGNLFNQHTTPTDSYLVGWGGADNTTVTRYSTPAAVAQAKNTAWVNSSTTGSIPIADMTAAKASAATTAVPLPVDVAAATGQPVGTKTVGVFTTS